VNTPLTSRTVRMSRPRRPWLWGPFWGALAVGAMGLGGCPGQSVTEVARFQAALPTDSLLALTLPGGEDDAGPADGVYRGGAVGLPSKLHRATVATTRFVRAGLVTMTALIHQVTSAASPERAGASRVIWRAEVDVAGGARRERAVVVDRVVDNFFTFQLVERLSPSGDGGQPSGAVGGGASWRVLVAGNFTPSGDPLHGLGAAWLNLDAFDKASGKILCLWSNAGDERTVTATFYRVSLPGVVLPQEPMDASYHFQQNADRGLAVFEVEVDADEGELGTAAERTVVISRWNRKTGAGRADAGARDGDLPGAGIALARRTQCWGRAAFGFPLRYDAAWAVDEQGETHALGSAQGQVSACVFPKAVQPVLPPRGAEPSVPAPVSGL